MQFAVVAGSEGWHVRDFSRASVERGHRVHFIDFQRLQASLGMNHLEIDRVDAMLVRSMPLGSLEQVIFRMDVLHRQQVRGVQVINPPLALETCIDKYLALAKLEAEGLPIPPTMVCQNVEEAMSTFGLLGQDVVVKPLFGSEGRGMIHLTDSEIAWRTFKTLERIQAVIYLQKYIEHPGWDLRVFVLGGKVLASMKRHGKGDWRTNVAQGGTGEPVVITSDLEELALRSARCTDIVAGGIDLLQDNKGDWVVLEVNAVPGWRALSRICKIDVATEIIKFLEARL